VRPSRAPFCGARDRCTREEEVRTRRKTPIETGPRKQNKRMEERKKKKKKEKKKKKKEKKKEKKEKKEKKKKKKKKRKKILTTYRGSGRT
jgi:FKBP-type peptidyl-prolyl cis-trans isomerase